MDFRHPSEYFIKYLITLPQDEAREDNWVVHKVQVLGYPQPSRSYLTTLRGVMAQDFPVDYNPLDRYNRETLKYLRKHKISTLHDSGDHDAREATLILADIQARKLIEQLLLGRVSSREISTRLTERLRRTFAPTAIDVFSHYFFNCAIMRTNDWVPFFDAYDRNDAQRALSVIQNGPQMALHVAGFRQELESKDMLREMMEAVMFDFRDWKNQPRSTDKTKALATLTKAAAQIDERMSESSTAIQDHLQQFKAWKIKQNEKSVKSIEELAPHGNFSESGTDIKELPEKT
jgi:hypothetical protein